MTRNHFKPRARGGFTLIELMTVIAITAILLTIIVVPIFQTFNFLRTAQGYGEAQQKARLLTDRLSREIANSAGVRDNSGIKGSITVRVPGPSPSAGVDGPPVLETLPFLKLDIVKPFEGEPGTGPSGAFVDPNTNKEDPTLHAPKGQVTLPVAPGSTYVRYFVGLRKPIADDGLSPADYTNPYDGLLMQRTGKQDNLYVLYRVEFQPYIYVLVNNVQTYVANTYPNVIVGNTTIPNPTGIFTADANGKIVDFDDPTFFLADGTADKAQRIRNWATRATITTELSRFDMIQPVYNISSRKVTYDTRTDFADNTSQPRPRLIPLIQFRPTRISSEPAEGMSAVRLGEESDGSASIAPDVFRTKFGGWTSTIVRTFPTGFDPVNFPEYLIGRTDPTNGMAGSPPGMSIYATNGVGSIDDTTGGTELFDMFRYQAEVASGGGLNLYPFTDAANAANTRSGWLAMPAMRAIFVPYYADTATGKLVCSFPIDEVGSGNFPPNGNVPTVASTVVNADFSATWLANPQLRPNIHRFIDLRVTNNPAGNTPSPLHPDPTIGFARARIVPGSEQVIGPDQFQGPHYGMPVRYVRTTHEPGPNQYRLNYVNQTEPVNYSDVFSGYGNPPLLYDPLNFVSTHLQARYRAGYLQLNSDPNVPLPDGQIQVSYRFQFTSTTPPGGATNPGGDVFAVDYDSRQVMSVLLTIKNFPQTSLPNPQTVTLRATATVRNFLR